MCSIGYGLKYFGSAAKFTVTMARKYLTNYELRQIIEESDEYETIDADGSDIGDNVEEQI